MWNSASRGIILNFEITLTNNRRLACMQAQSLKNWWVLSTLKRGVSYWESTVICSELYIYFSQDGMLNQSEQYSWDGEQWNSNCNLLTWKIHIINQVFWKTTKSDICAWTFQINSDFILLDEYERTNECFINIAILSMNHTSWVFSVQNWHTFSFIFRLCQYQKGYDSYL